MCKVILIQIILFCIYFLTNVRIFAEQDSKQIADNNQLQASVIFTINAVNDSISIGRANEACDDSVEVNHSTESLSDSEKEDVIDYQTYNASVSNVSVNDMQKIDIPERNWPDSNRIRCELRISCTYSGISVSAYFSVVFKATKRS